MQRLEDPGAFRALSSVTKTRGENSRFRARERDVRSREKRSDRSHVCQTRRSLHARRELSGRSRWFRESRVWVTRWRADNARNFGFEFCATIVTARHAPEAVAGCSAAGCNDIWLWLWVVVRVVGISIICLPIRDWDLIYVALGAIAEFLRRHSRMPTWIRRWRWVPCYEYRISWDVRTVCDP